MSTRIKDADLTVVMSAFDMALVGNAATIRFETNRTTFGRARGEFATTLAENLAARAVCAAARDTAHRAIAQSIELRVARSARRA